MAEIIGGLWLSTTVFTLFPSISGCFVPRNKPLKLSILRVSYISFSFSVVLPSSFVFIIVLLSPFAFLGFRTVGYIYPCILDYEEKFFVPPSFPYLACTPESRIFTPFRPAHPGATPQHPQLPSLVLRTRPQPSAPRHVPATAAALFCLFWARPTLVR